MELLTGVNRASICDLGCLKSEVDGEGLDDWAGDGEGADEGAD